MNTPEKKRLSHLSAEGTAAMVDVGGKPIERRRAVAEAFFVAAPATIDAVLSANLPKGEALAVARVAAIQAAKRCDELIPLCHSLSLDVVDVSFERTGPDRIRALVAVGTSARTGVEMEALTGASVAALTLYDMAKAIDRSLRIDGVRLVEKTKSPVRQSG